MPKSITNIYHLHSSLFPLKSNRTDDFYDFIELAESRGIESFSREAFESLKQDHSLVENSIVQHIVSSKKIDFDLQYLSRYTQSMNIEAIPDGNTPIVFIDELLEYSLLGFFLAVNSYAGNQSDANRKQCFTQIFELLDLQGRKQILATYDKNSSDDWLLMPTNLMHYASDTYWSAWTFVIGHELYHIQNWKKEQSIEDELLADAYGYEILMHMIDEQKKGNLDNEISAFYDYLYLAPVMLLEFDRLLDFYKKLIGQPGLQTTHPEPEKRQEHLFSLFDSHVPDDMDTTTGNGLLNCFLNIVEEFRKELVEKWDNGDFQNGKWRF